MPQIDLDKPDYQDITPKNWFARQPKWRQLWIACFAGMIIVWLFI